MTASGSGLSAAILAADVVGYSRLMAEDEEATLAAFNARRDVIEERISGHHGRVFGGAGDSAELFRIANEG